MSPWQLSIEPPLIPGSSPDLGSLQSLTSRLRPKHRTVPGEAWTVETPHLQSQWPPMQNIRPEFDCPQELWINILDNACRDGGSTYRSLSQVSRRFREIAEGHRYNSLKIKSNSQLIELEERLGLNNGTETSSKRLNTRFLYISLPTTWFYRDIPKDKSSLLGAVDSDRGDKSYEPSKSEESGGSSRSELSDDDDEEPYEYKELEDEELMELENDIRSLKNDRWKQTPIFLGPDVLNLDDLEKKPVGVSPFEYKLYRALRSLLEACADRLEVLVFELNPAHLIPLRLLFPVLPRLQYLSLNIKNPTWTISQAPPANKKDGATVDLYRTLLFPSLRALRFLGSNSTMYMLFHLWRHLGYLPLSAYTCRASVRDHSTANGGTTLDKYWLQDIAKTQG